MTYYGYKRIIEDITYLREFLMVHACIFAEFDDQLIGEDSYFEKEDELMELQRLYPHHSRVAPHHEFFENWELGVIQANFPTDLPWVMRKARYLLNMCKRRNY